MLEVGTLVKVSGVFASDFPDVYEITEVHIHEDGQVAYILGELGAFDIKYLEAAE